MKVNVLLSSYNGSNFIAEQLSSLVNQDYSSFHIYCRDDGSSDNTVDIIHDYVRMYPDLVSIIDNNYSNLGVKDSFLYMLEFVDESSCVMFCDQDDVWFPNKISLFVDQLKMYDSSGPKLVFGDMVVVSENLESLSDSFWGFQKLRINSCNDWEKILVSNIVTGCSSLLNPDAVILLKNVPDVPILHDHLSAIIVAKYGTLIPLPDPTMYYRQHNSNVEGARKFSASYILYNLKNFLFVMLPRYRKVCTVFGLSLSKAFFLKLINILQRLFLLR